ncbi:hypothetical protein Tco_0869463 [Tanacetum coccineum]
MNLFYDSWNHFEDLSESPESSLSIWTLIESFSKHSTWLSRYIINLTAEGDLRKFSDIGAWDDMELKPESTHKPTVIEEYTSARGLNLEE